MATEKIDLNNLDKSYWKTYRFDEIAQNISERVDPNNTDLEVYIGLEHIDSESLHIKRHGTPDDVNGTKLKFYKDDIIFGRRRAYQRKAGIATCDGFCSAHALVLRANPEIIDPELFPFFMHSDLFMNRAVDISVGSLSPTINWGTLKHQEFLIPPKNIQSELVKLFFSLEFSLLSTQVLSDHLRLTKELIVGDFFNKRYLNDPKVKSEYYSIKRLDECLVAFQNGYAFSSNKYVNDGIPIITMANISLDGEFKPSNTNHWVHDENLSRYSLDKGSLIIAMTDVTPSKNLIGRMAIVDKVGPYYLNQRVGWLKLNEEILLPKYLQIFSNSQKFRWFSKSHSTLGVQSNLGTEDIKKAWIPVPDLHIQKELINIIEKTESSMSENFRKILSAEILKKSIINQVF